MRRLVPVLLLAAACTSGISSTTKDNCRLVDESVATVQGIVTGVAAGAKASTAREVQTEADTVGRLADYEDEKVVEKQIRFVHESIQAVADVLVEGDPATALASLSTATTGLNTVCGV